MEKADSQCAMSRRALQERTGRNLATAPAAAAGVALAEAPRLPREPP